jgi:hypothetical protein
MERSALVLLAKEFNEFRTGDILEADLVTPVALRVAEPQTEAALNAEAVKEVPAVFGFNPVA